MNKHGGYFGKNKDMLDFSVNLNPLGIPATASAFMMAQVQNLDQYPELYAIEAREALANKLFLHPEEIIMGNGATELIYLFARTMKAKKVLLIQPTFNEYERAFKQYGAVCIYHLLKPETQFSLNLPLLLEEIRVHKPEVVVICNPNNPTGRYIEKEMLEQILITLSAYSGYLMVDESFYEFENQETAISLLSDEHLLIIRSMTKFYAIAGVRLGYGLGHSVLIKQMNRYKEPWTLNGLAGHIVPILLDDLSYQGQTHEWYMQEKVYMMEHLQKLSFITPFESHVNFFLCKTTLPSTQVMALLLEKGIYIRTCEDFIGLEKHYIRLALRSRKDNERLIQALTRVQNKLDTSTEENHVI